MEKMQKTCLTTETLRLQRKTECEIQAILEKNLPSKLNWAAHERLLLNSIYEGLPNKVVIIESSKPWFAYWLLNSLSVCNCIDKIEENPYLNNLIDNINSCKSTEGGYGGAYCQAAHTATTYSAILSLATIGTKKALESINRDEILRYFLSLKNPDGSFAVHKDGESDVRGTYTVIAISSLLGILNEEIARGVVEWVCRCQSYEGGFGGCPGDEAHGGYSFCAFAILVILNKPFSIDFCKFVNWTLKRQQTIEGGFNGRTGKLVDGCYTFWVGALIPLIKKVTKNDYLKENLFSENQIQKLKDFVFAVCQSNLGGFRDRDKKPIDLYHTCYCLSGLAAFNLNFSDATEKKMNFEETEIEYNITKKSYLKVREYFKF